MSDHLLDRSYGPTEIRQVAGQLLGAAGTCRAWLFTGEPGAGKTTLIRAVAEALGIDPSMVSSPTFSLHQVYASGDVTVHHFDLYRIRNERELLDIGMDEYLEGDDRCMVEWPAVLDHLRPMDYLDIRILHPATNEPDTRHITVQHITQ